jgi:HlyD family secretion protein
LGQELSNALVVPTVAIVTQDGNTGVMVPALDNNKPTFKPVTIGPTIQNQTQILEGLKQDERVFIDLPQEFKREKEDKQNED